MQDDLANCNAINSNILLFTNVWALHSSTPANGWVVKPKLRFTLTPSEVISIKRLWHNKKLKMAGYLKMHHFDMNINIKCQPTFQICPVYHN